MFCQEVAQISVAKQYTGKWAKQQRFSGDLLSRNFNSPMEMSHSEVYIFWFKILKIILYFSGFLQLLWINSDDFDDPMNFQIALNSCVFKCLHLSIFYTIYIYIYIHSIYSFFFMTLYFASTVQHNGIHFVLFFVTSLYYHWIFCVLWVWHGHSILILISGVASCPIRGSKWAEPPFLHLPLFVSFQTQGPVWVIVIDTLI